MNNSKCGHWRERWTFTLHSSMNFSLRYRNASLHSFGWTWLGYGIISSHFDLNVASKKSSSTDRTSEWSAASFSSSSVTGQPIIKMAFLTTLSYKEKTENNQRVNDRKDGTLKLSLSKILANKDSIFNFLCLPHPMVSNSSSFKGIWSLHLWTGLSLY